METVIGWNYFTIRSFDPVELGLAFTTRNDYTIELRQQYFYLLWIPCFGLGKKWMARKNGELYELPASIRTSLKARNDLSIKTPWYTFAGLFLLLFFALGCLVYKQYQSYQWKKELAKQFATGYTDNIRKFDQPSLNDYYVLAAADGYSWRFAKLMAFDAHTIQLAYINNSTAWAATPGGIAALFDQHAQHLQTITINRQQPASVICDAYEKTASFKGMMLPDNGNYRIDRIIRLNGPILKNNGFESYGEDGKAFIEVSNIGLPAVITKIDAISGDMHWTAKQLPIHLSSNGNFVLSGEGNINTPYKVQFTCTGANGQTQYWLMQGQGYERTFAIMQ